MKKHPSDIKFKTVDNDLFHNLTSLVCQVCGVQYSVIAVVERGDLIIKSSQGENGMNDSELFALLEKTLVKKDLKEISIKSTKLDFMSLPVQSKEGELVGVVAVLHNKKHSLSASQKETFQAAVNQVAGVIALESSKGDYLNMVESSRDMIYELDQRANFIFANKATISKTGYSLDELKNMQCWDLIEESEKTRVIDFYLEKIKAKEKSIYHEFPIISKTGKRIWLGQSVDFIWEAGMVVKTIAISKDITELIDTRMRLKETEEQILAEKTLLKTMVFSSPAAIAMFSKDLKYLAFSEKWIEEKYLHEQTLGLGEEAIPEEKEKQVQDLKAQVLEGEVVSKERDVILDGNGDERWLKWVASPWNNTTDGSMGGIIMYADDITHTVKHENELKKMKEEALTLSKAKEEFLSNMSHEIRTPLNAIIGTTNLMLDENPSLREDEKFKLLKFSSSNLLSLINNVLDFSKIESGNIEIEENDFDLQDLTKNLVDSWKPIANKKEVDLQLKWNKGIPKVVKGDRIRLSQIINNLINNALKFTDEGFVHLNISLVDKANDLIRFEVKDTGVGIPDHMHEKVFQSFQQVNNEKTLEQGGTGLGLPICERLLRLMNSKLELQSSEGFGSKFFFTINLEPGEMDSAEEFEGDVESSKLTVKALLVEDNTANQFIAASFLDKWGVSFKVANNGKEALEYISDDPTFDIILMDIKMPIMDGPEATAEIRKMDDPYYQRVPIVALTASAITDIKKEGTAHLFDDYLAKPFNPKDLFKLLSRFSDTEKPMRFDQNEIEVPSSEKNDLRSQLEVYIDGDTEFLVEFAGNIQENIIELETELPVLNRSKDVEKLSGLVHMVKPSIEILGEYDLVNQLRDLRENWKAGKYPERLLSNICNRSTEIIEELTELISKESTVH